MTPKEKAKELIHKYVALTDGWVYGKSSWEYKKQCALIAVNEIINESSEKIHRQGRSLLSDKEYWQQVKQELEKL